MSAVTNDRDFIQKAMMHGINQRIAEIMEEEIAKAQASITQRLRSEVDKIALNLTNFYTVDQRREEVVITVRKELTR